MIVGHGRTFALGLAAAGALLASGCTRIRDHQGYIAEETLISAVQPGVDNRDSVLSTLGRPTFVGQFSENDWYYVSRNTRNLAFNMPRPDSQTVLRVRFDQAGNVASVDRKGLEQVVSIDPSNDKTPTLGRERGFIEELFGNIGAVGATGQSGGSADNPK
ncbi:outer membrane protein assembly factor BamE [Sphingomonas parva]|uniref:Outer membrane protein assembly factor BamE n=1 Tax=Sphingomonas parva TaxID=2555898 RepID=A0A4Y8ZMH8_9SPHN|nr:outer membrane protein assembly factor BamE [Sphingomonas parva]TFI57223.1 outer membrane protein assembly factor BamE [Sphingomonas parva]